MSECYLCHGEFPEESMKRYEDPMGNDRFCHVCTTCVAVDANIVAFTGYRPTEFYPVGFMDTYLAYDGETSNRRRNPLMFYYEQEHNLFECCRCCDRFYGSSTWMQDAEESWCAHCADNYAYYSEYNGEYYADSENAPDEDNEEDRDGCRANVEEADAINGFRIFPGEETAHFLAKPLVGIEFEHAPVRLNRRGTSNDSLFRVITEGVDPLTSHPWRHKFAIHGDGSIKYQDGYGSSEIVSMPASGKQLEDIINRFYSPFADGTFTPGPEHNTCGFHMHVGSEYLFMMKRGMSDGQPACTDNARTMLNDMTTICKEFVSSSRRMNTYCSDPTGVRDKAMTESGTKQMLRIFGRGGYPALAVRTFGTVEFRIWPSSNSIKNTKARAELSQKLIAYFDKALIKDGQFCYNEAMADAIGDIADACSGGARTMVPYHLRDLLGLSERCVTALMQMTERFNPFSHKKTTFKFTHKQISCLVNESTEAGLNLHGMEASKITCAGDTTMLYGDSESSYGKEYIAFGEPCPCYEDEATSGMPAIVAKLAKGEE